MPDPDPELLLSPALVALSLLQLAFFFVGLALLWRRRHRWRERLTGEFPARLAPSSRSVGSMLLACLIVVAGGLAGQITASHFGRTSFPPAADGTMGLFHVVAGAGFQLGLLAGLLAARLALHRPRAESLPAEPGLGAWAAVGFGALTFVAALPPIWLASLVWRMLLDWLGIEAPPQDIVLFFANNGDTRALVVMMLLAVGIAPLVEELLFRAGLFRWLRTRTSRPASLLLPALIFASLHGSLAALAPLLVLAVILSLAYERSGHVLTPITAHALFNLNTLLILLAGFPA